MAKQKAHAGFIRQATVHVRACSAAFIHLCQSTLIPVQFHVVGAQSLDIVLCSIIPLFVPPGGWRRCFQSAVSAARACEPSSSVKLAEWT